MICVIKTSPTGDVTGWMMGTDMHDLRRKAEMAFDRDMAEIFYRMEFTPPPGKYTPMPGLTMLVE